MILNPDGEKRESGRKQSMFITQQAKQDNFLSQHFKFPTEHYCIFIYLFIVSGSWNLLRSIRRACVFVYIVCVFVLHARERKRESQSREGLRGWGFNDREADGAEGRRLMQHRAREGKKERQDFEQIGWMSGTKRLC